ncbi:MAG: glycoside hydrolase family 125 protein [Spirochaetaceae bacterium]
MNKKLESILKNIDKVTDEHSAKIESEQLKKMLKQCFRNTLETTVKWDDELFIITGDIPAMWLRDSTAQVKHYIPYVNKIDGLGELVEKLITRQIGFINHDPYANAFNSEPNGKGHKDETELSPLVWERKYEIDSLCYPIWLSYLYFKESGSTTIFKNEFLEAIKNILITFETEQNHGRDSKYSFQRFNCPESDTIPCGGRGTEVTYTGMTWSGFRPSDDACKYGYLIPANMMASVNLGYIQEICLKIYKDEDLANRAKKLQEEIDSGIMKYGIYNHPEFGEIFAYETDGLGNYNLMDDANVPSLLSIPYLGYVDANNPIYKNTRRFILSKSNPYYFHGNFAKGVGSPHTPEDYFWPIGLSIQGLTSTDKKEQKEILDILLNTHAGTGFIHEGVNVNNPKEFTRPWFAWANSIFSEFVIRFLSEGETVG